MKDIIKKAKEKLKTEGVEVTHLFIQSAAEINDKLDKPGQKHIVNLEGQGLKFEGNLWEMDVYSIKAIPKDKAYFLDYSVIPPLALFNLDAADEEDKNKFLKAYEAMNLKYPKQMASIGDL